MASNTKKQSSGIKVCFVAYRPAITESDVDDLVNFIVIVAQEGFKTIKAA